MDIAFDGRDEKFSLGAGGFAGGGGAGFFGFHERREVGDGALHHAGGFDDLREKHFAGAEEVADDAHAVHERALDDVEWARVFLAAFLGVGVDELVDAFDEGVREPGFDRGVAPGEIFFDLGLRGTALGGFQIFGKFDETVGGVGATVQEDVFDVSAERGLDLVVVAEHAGVDDAHVHALADGVVKKSRVNRLAYGVVAAEREGDVGNAAGDFGAGEGLFDDARGLEEIDRVVIVLLDASRDGEDVGIENDVFGWEAEALGEKFVGAGADADLFVARGGLALFVEGHHDGGGAVAHDQLRAAEEFGFAVFEGDGIDDAFALEALEAGFEDGPLRGIDHHGHAADVGLGGDQVEELHHRGLTLDERFVDIDVDDVGAALDLLFGDGEAGVPVAGFEGLGEFRRAGDVGALTDDEEVGGGAGRGSGDGSGHEAKVTKRLTNKCALRDEGDKSSCAVVENELKADCEKLFANEIGGKSDFFVGAHGLVPVGALADMQNIMYRHVRWAVVEKAGENTILIAAYGDESIGSGPSHCVIAEGQDEVAAGGQGGSGIAQKPSDIIRTCKMS